MDDVAALLGTPGNQLATAEQLSLLIAIALILITEYVYVFHSTYQMQPLTDIQYFHLSTDIQDFLQAIAKSDQESLSFNEILPIRCSKNTGGRKKRKGTVQINAMLKTSAQRDVVLPTKMPRSRGILINVRPCGHINSVVPIYR
jgi:hypothetical protein